MSVNISSKPSKRGTLSLSNRNAFAFIGGETTLSSTKTRTISPNLPDTFPEPIPDSSLLWGKSQFILALFQIEFGTTEIGLSVSIRALYYRVQPFFVCKRREAISLIRWTVIPCSRRSKSIWVSNSNPISIDTNTSLSKIYGELLSASLFSSYFFYPSNSLSRGNYLLINDRYPLVRVLLHNFSKVLLGPFTILPIFSTFRKGRLFHFILFLR
jgi:hypothetical protein